MFRKLRGLLTFALAAASWAAGPAAGQAPSFSAAKTFAHATILSGNPTTLTIRLQNTSKTLAVSTIGFADIFPPGMVLIPGLDPVFQCGGTLSLSGATVARRAG